MLQENFKEILHKGLTLDHIFLLYLIKCGIYVDTEDTKINSLLRGLKRKELIYSEDKVLKCYPVGSDLADFWDTTTIKPVVVVQTIDDFERWWAAYPGTDTFIHENKTFTGSRALRVRKEDCRLQFNKIILQGEYTVDKLIAALNIEINQKKAASVKSGVNKLSYMQNSLTYLNQKTYEPYMTLIGKTKTEPRKEVSI